jgi:hypothetical protein
MGAVSSLDDKSESNYQHSMVKYMLAGEFEQRHGEGVNLGHLSTWQR